MRCEVVTRIVAEKAQPLVETLQAIAVQSQREVRRQPSRELRCLLRRVPDAAPTISNIGLHHLQRHSFLKCLILEKIDFWFKNENHEDRKTIDVGLKNIQRLGYELHIDPTNSSVFK